MDTCQSDSDSSQYEIVQDTPILEGGDIEKKLIEIINELDMNNDKKEETILPSPSSLDTPDQNKVGHSIFYDCMDLDSSQGVETMNPPSKEPDEEVSDIEQGCTKFSGITYLGAVIINEPKSEIEICRKMEEMNALSSNNGINVSVSIPNGPDGVVVLYDSKNAVVATYEVQHIIFYTPGPINTADSSCFAFTFSHGAESSQIFQCQVFRCQIPEAVCKINNCFKKAFNNEIGNSMSSSIGSILTNADNVILTPSCSDLVANQISQAMYEFNVSLEIREKVSKNTYSPVVRDKNVFKLRCNIDKEVCILVKQVPPERLPPLFIERCFGVLLSPGKLVRQADMRLLDLSHMGYIKNSESISNSALAPYQIQAEWIANEKAFELLNTESSKMCLTVAVDLVIKQISEPVRFVIETMVSVANQNESRLMDNLLLSKRPLLQKFYLQLKNSCENGMWEVASIDPSEEIIETSSQVASLRNFTKNLTKMVRSQSAISFDFDDISFTDVLDNESDGDEPLLSGTGEVSKECSIDSLEEWSNILQEWDSLSFSKRPKNLANLVKLGIPEALRCKVWQKLACNEFSADLMERYRILITKDTPCETIIQRDINRTFPAHKFFKDSGGQDSLYKVSKCYAVYDAEVGYCQGLSFIAASLLLHMPEEEAFAVLVAIMYDYQLRDLYKLGFESLYLRLYQLSRLLKDQIPDLFDHFELNGIETHMFASQWFLTLFTAKFPLCFVFHVLDLFFLDGINVLFQVAMTLLYFCKKDLLELDFEGILKYIRVSLPKKCRSENHSRKIMKMVCDWKVKKLKKYEAEYQLVKQEEERQQVALKYFQEKLEQEKKVLKTEIDILKSHLQESEKQKNQAKNIISEYKQIIQRQEQEINRSNTTVENISAAVRNCTKCSSNIQQYSPLHKPIQEKGLEDVALNNLNMNLNHPLDPLHGAHERIRELELELAKTKLEKVEAECRNQDLKHKITIISENYQKNIVGNTSWQPWLSKTLTSIQEKVNTTKWDMSTFQTMENFGPSNELKAKHYKNKLLQQDNNVGSENTTVEDDEPYKNH